jgi:hypothetical protein
MGLMFLEIGQSIRPMPVASIFQIESRQLVAPDEVIRQITGAAIVSEQAASGCAHTGLHKCRYRPAHPIG